MDFDDSLNDRDRIIREHAGVAYKVILSGTRELAGKTLWDKDDAFQAFVVVACNGFATFCKARKEHCESEDHAKRFEVQWVKMCARTGINETRRMKAVCRVPRLIVERGNAFNAAVREIEASGGTVTAEAVASRINLPVSQVRLIEAGQAYADVIDEPANVEIAWREDQEKTSNLDERIEEIKTTAKNVLTHEAYRIWSIHCLEPNSKRKAWHRCHVTRKFALKSVDESMRKIREALTGQGEPCDPS